jgi:hypothetical protein
MSYLPHAVLAYGLRIYPDQAGDWGDLPDPLEPLTELVDNLPALDWHTAGPGADWNPESGVLVYLLGSATGPGGDFIMPVDFSARFAHVTSQAASAEFRQLKQVADLVGQNVLTDAGWFLLADVS